MPTNFPTNPDTYTTKVDGVDTVMAAHINNLQDAMMAVEDFALDLRDGWCYDTDTWVYVSPTSFKIAGKNVAYRFPKGTKIKLVQSGATKYFYVVATAYSTDTTITITGGSDYTLASATISGQAYSYAAAPQGFPAYFNWTPTFTGFSTNPTGYHRFKIIDNICFLFVKEDTGTSNSGGFTLTAPVTPIIFEYCIARICDNGITPTAPGLIEFYDLTMHIYKSLDGMLFTNSGTKWAQFIMQYLF